MTKKAKAVDQYIDIGILLENIEDGMDTSEALASINKGKKRLYDVIRRYPRLDHAYNQALKRGRLTQLAIQELEGDCDIEYVEVEQPNPTVREIIGVAVFVALSIAAIVLAIAGRVYIFTS